MRNVRLFIILVLLSLLLPNVASANSNLEVKIEYGVDNKVQQYKGFPVRVELKNNGDYIKGDLAIFSSASHNAAGTYVIPVEIGAQETKVIEMSIKGMNDYYSYNGPNTPNYISFYEGGIEKGKEVKLGGNPSAKPRYLPDNRLVVGVLSNNFDAVNYMKLVRYNAESIELLHVPADRIPTESFGLEMFDVLLVQDFAISTLTNEQQQAIHQWVSSGGAFIYDTKIGIGNDLGEMNDLLLFEPSAEVQLSSIVQESNMPNGLTTYTGEVTKENVQVVAKDGEAPLVFRKTIGLGKVTQINSNLSSESWKEWDRLNNWWGVILQNVANKNYNRYHPSFYENMSYQLTSIGESFPGSIISVPLLMLAFVIYLIILVPVLYFILYKRDKREHAWWIIPTVAIVTSASVFVVGAKDRIASTQINESTILILDGEDSQKASGVGAISILTNSGGTYSISTESESADLFPTMYGYESNFDTVSRYAYIQTGVQGQEVTYNDVDYWSIRSMVGKIQSVEVGSMNVDLGIEGNEVVGTVENLLRYELKDAHFLAGRNVTKLGDIKTGESVPVKIEINQGNVANALTPPTTFSIANVYPTMHQKLTQHYNTNVDKSELEEWRKYQMLSALLNNNQQFSVDQPLIIGYISQSLLDPKVNGKKEATGALHLVAIPVTMKTDGIGSFQLKDEHFTPSIQVSEGKSGTVYHNALDYGEQYVHLAPGNYTVQYELPDLIDRDRDDINVLKIKLRSRDKNMEYFIYNYVTNELESLPSDHTITLSESVENYISDTDTIQLVMEISYTNDREITVPGIELEGEINHDRN